MAVTLRRPWSWQSSLDWWAGADDQSGTPLLANFYSEEEGPWWTGQQPVALVETIPWLDPLFADDLTRAAGKIDPPSILKVGIGTVDNSQIPMNTISVPAPSGSVAGQVMILSIAFSGGSNTQVFVPAGWVLINRTNNGTFMGLASYWRAYRTGETGYGLNLSNNTYACAGIQTWTNVDPIMPVNAASGRATTGQGPIITAPAVVATTLGRLVCVFASDRQATWSGLSPDLIARYNLGINTNSHVGMQDTDGTISVLGSTGTHQDSVTPNGNGVGQTIVLNLIGQAAVDQEEPAYTSFAQTEDRTWRTRIIRDDENSGVPVLKDFPWELEDAWQVSFGQMGLVSAPGACQEAEEYHSIPVLLNFYLEQEEPWQVSFGPLPVETFVTYPAPARDEASQVPLKNFYLEDEPPTLLLPRPAVLTVSWLPLVFLDDELPIIFRFFYTDLEEALFVSFPNMQQEDRPWLAQPSLDDELLQSGFRVEQEENAYPGPQPPIWVALSWLDEHGGSPLANLPADDDPPAPLLMEDVRWYQQPPTEEDAAQPLANLNTYGDTNPTFVPLPAVLTTPWLALPSLDEAEIAIPFLMDQEEGLLLEIRERGQETVTWVAAPFLDDEAMQATYQVEDEAGVSVVTFTLGSPLPLVMLLARLRDDPLGQQEAYGYPSLPLTDTDDWQPLLPPTTVQPPLLILQSVAASGALTANLPVHEEHLDHTELAGQPVQTFPVFQPAQTDDELGAQLKFLPRDEDLPYTAFTQPAIWTATAVLDEHAIHAITYLEDEYQLIVASVPPWPLSAQAPTDEHAGAQLNLFNLEQQDDVPRERLTVTWSPSTFLDDELGTQLKDYYALDDEQPPPLRMVQMAVPWVLPVEEIVSHHVVLVQFWLEQEEHPLLPLPPLLVTPWLPLPWLDDEVRSFRFYLEQEDHGADAVQVVAWVGLVTALEDEGAALSAFGREEEGVPLPAVEALPPLTFFCVCVGGEEEKTGPAFVPLPTTMSDVYQPNPAMKGTWKQVITFSGAFGLN